mmetsp:Transcript_9366/g.16594  ORF Transcript_9366/g.16594 Transcript_9366/m.16594 type:complete len:367 (+) Transcript_9366:85-1185(+)|eukprot:CAMPEP_0197658406 /NCGR_PEP_ID=MMETSP1338-20131121/45220_1 /TAXON_ID=43686 ORGANISM="Pelagodinium beii, Strain RCC1491" /NCGR_SAMPLE_ID=MMETSP1338 /ASSEMBLY_ACC=CAM_ASM_000754 /LENGTH=366 /DNA_ID=CAMNT_0043234991 /DNA_START=85 /DNA_END=1185 /DNA_ORIENTATION=+
MASKLVLVALAYVLSDASKEIDRHALEMTLDAAGDMSAQHASQPSQDMKLEEAQGSEADGKENQKKLEEAEVPAPAKVTSPNLVSGLSVLTATQGVETVIRLLPSGQGSLDGGKAVFIPSNAGCRTAVPSVAINANGEGTFKILGEAGTHKVCFQAQGAVDSVEQVAAANNGEIKLELLQATSTDPVTVTAIFPRTITVNVPTMIDFEGSNTGDQAIFVNSVTGSCETAEPDKDVGAGHNMFTIVTTGTFKLCYRVPGASDSVEQSNISLTVRAPGVTQDMTERWPRFIKKDGSLDCSNLTNVPFCARGLINDCDDTFAVEHGIGYKCFWDTSLWPPACSVDTQSSDETVICRTGTCGGGEVPSCW